MFKQKSAGLKSLSIITVATFAFSLHGTALIKTAFAQGENAQAPDQENRQELYARAPEKNVKETPHLSGKAMLDFPEKKSPFVTLKEDTAKKQEKTAEKKEPVANKKVEKENAPAPAAEKIPQNNKVKEPQIPSPKIPKVTPEKNNELRDALKALDESFREKRKDLEEKNAKQKEVFREKFDTLQETYRGERKEILETGKQKEQREKLKELDAAWKEKWNALRDEIEAFRKKMSEELKELMREHADKRHELIENYRKANTETPVEAIEQPVVAKPENVPVPMPEMEPVIPSKTESPAAEPLGAKEGVNEDETVLSKTKEPVDVPEEKKMEEAKPDVVEDTKEMIEAEKLPAPDEEPVVSKKEIESVENIAAEEKAVKAVKLPEKTEAVPVKTIPDKKEIESPQATVEEVEKPKAGEPMPEPSVPVKPEIKEPATPEDKETEKQAMESIEPFLNLEPPVNFEEEKITVGIIEVPGTLSPEKAEELRKALETLKETYREKKESLQEKVMAQKEAFLEKWRELRKAFQEEKKALLETADAAERAEKIKKLHENWVAQWKLFHQEAEQLKDQLLHEFTKLLKEYLEKRQEIMTQFEPKPRQLPLLKKLLPEKN